MATLEIHSLVNSSICEYHDMGLGLGLNQDGGVFSSGVQF